jgi:hypothetical protein
MDGLGSVLAHRADGDGHAEHEPMEGDGADSKKMAEASVRAFFEAGKSGDFAAAAEHLSSAIEHCQASDYGDGDPGGDEGGDGAEGGGGHHALLLIPHK